MWLEEEGYSQRIIEVFESVFIPLDGLSFVLTNQPVRSSCIIYRMKLMVRLF